MEKLRNIGFTINNPTKADYDALDTCCLFCSYLTYGKEHFCPECTNPHHGACGSDHDNCHPCVFQTPHLQGYMEFTAQIRFKTLKKRLPRANFCPRKGSAKQASAYCHQEDPSPFVHGVLKEQGSRSDLTLLAAQVTSGITKRALAEVNPVAVLKFSRGIQVLYNLSQPKRDANVPKIIDYYYGPTGTHKTRNAFEAHPDAYMWGPENGKWWDEYDGEKTVIIDEYRGQLPFGYLLKLTDRYPMRVEVKGSFVQFVPDHIIFTSCKPPWMLYEDQGTFDQADQWRRRIHKIYHQTSPDSILEVEWRNPPGSI